MVVVVEEEIVAIASTTYIATNCAVCQADSFCQAYWPSCLKFSPYHVYFAARSGLLPYRTNICSFSVHILLNSSLNVLLVDIDAMRGSMEVFQYRSQSEQCPLVV